MLLPLLCFRLLILTLPHVTMQCHLANLVSVEATKYIMYYVLYQ